MALLLRGKTRCPLCGATIGSGDKVVATSHFIADAADPLWPYSDAAMHEPCFLNWDQRGLFVRRFNQAVGSTTFGDGTHHHMNSDGSIVSLKRQNEAK
jgi:hypothetical protein